MPDADWEGGGESEQAYQAYGGAHRDNKGRHRYNSAREIQGQATKPLADKAEQAEGRHREEGRGW